MFLCWLIYFMPLCMAVTVKCNSDSEIEKLEESRDVILMELLRRVKLLEARATLIDTVEQNQQTQFESLHNLIKQQKEWLRSEENNTTSNRGTQCSELPSHIAFTAYLDNDMALGSEQTIIFNKVLLNEGSAYNEITGTFTAPLDGVYDFYFSVGQKVVSQIWARLFVNDIHMVSATAETLHVNQDVQGSNRVLVRLQKGDVVRVLHYSGSNVEGSSDLRVTTFSGMFLFE